MINATEKHRLRTELMNRFSYVMVISLIQDASEHDPDAVEIALRNLDLVCNTYYNQQMKAEEKCFKEIPDILKAFTHEINLPGIKADYVEIINTFREELTKVFKMIKEGQS